MEKFIAAKSAVRKLGIRLAVADSGKGDLEFGTGPEIESAIETDTGKKATTHIKEPQSPAHQPSLKAPGIAQPLASDDANADNDQRRGGTDIAALRLLQENRQLRTRLNHAERFIGQLQKEKEHVTAQRDWHSTDRDRIAAILVEHEEAAVSQWATICALSGEPASSGEVLTSHVADDGKNSEVQNARKEPKDLLNSIERELSAARVALASREAELEAIHRSRLWRIGQYYWGVLRILRWPGSRPS